MILLLLFIGLSNASDFSPFQQILSKFVKETHLPGGGYQTSFDYKSAFSNETFIGAVDRQKKIIKNFDVSLLKDRSTAIAFWVNAYNFFMIEKIFRDGTKKGKLSIGSVKDMGSFFSPYRAFSQDDFNVGGKKMTLDEIEKETLLGEAYKRRGWKDARVHFAVNCASVGCPPLLPTIYKAESLEKQLDDNVRKALNTKRHVYTRRDDLHVTHLFKWYKKDFVEERGSVRKWIEFYRPDVKQTTDIEYIPYDWKLNQPGNFKPDGSY